MKFGAVECSGGNVELGDVRVGWGSVSCRLVTCRAVLSCDGDVMFDVVAVRCCRVP